MTAMNSPFRYAGGKFYARKLILEHIVPHVYYAEPFAGGASIFFAKDKAATNVLNVTVHLVRGLSKKMVSAGGVRPLRTPFFWVLTPFRWGN